MFEFRADLIAIAVSIVIVLLIPAIILLIRCGDKPTISASALLVNPDFMISAFRVRLIFFRLLFSVYILIIADKKYNVNIFLCIFSLFYFFILLKGKLSSYCLNQILNSLFSISDLKYNISANCFLYNIANLVISAYDITNAN